MRILNTMGKNKFELDGLQQKTLSLFADSHLSKTFYWTGGTALTYLHLQHRKSEDLDLFSEKSFLHEELLSFIKILRQSVSLTKVVEKRIFNRHEFFLHNDSTLRLEFVHYDFPSLKKRGKWNGIYVDSLTDMAANKTMAMLDRHAPKDALDIYFLIHQSKFSPQKLLSLVKKKFGLSFPLSSFWDRALLAAQMLNNIRPLLLGNEKNQIKTINSILVYFEGEAANEMRKHLLGP